MKILVCVKEVPDFDPEVELKVDEAVKWIKDDDSSRYMMNRFDEFAVEEALLTKERFKGTTIDVLTVGQKRSHAVIRRAMGMGADHGIHIETSAEGYLDPFFIASLVSLIATQKEYDLILTGVMAEDTQQGQTGVMIAELFKLPWATSVIQADMSDDCKSIQVEREIEGGKRDVLKIKLPCLLTIQSGINQPRYPALSKVLKAKKTQLEVYQATDLIQLGFTQHVEEIVHPQKQRAGVFLEGSPEVKAQSLVSLLKEKSFIL